MNTKLSVGFQCHSTTCRQFCATTYAPVFEIKSILSMHGRSMRSCNHFVHSLREFCDSAPETPSYCCGCKGTFWGRPSLLLVGFLCSSCGKMCPMRTSKPPAVPVVSLLAGGWCTKVSNDVTQVLCTLAGATAHMNNLQHLGLHQLPMSLDLVPMLGQIFKSLECSLMTLTIDAYIVNNVQFGAAEKALFFGAVARAKRLKELHMLKWEEIVGIDAGACVAALQSLLQLEVVVVSKVKEEPGVFPGGLRFRAAEEEP